MLSQILLSDNLFMINKFVALIEFYEFGFHKKIVTQKHLSLQAFFTPTLRNFIGGRTFNLQTYKIYN